MQRVRLLGVTCTLLVKGERKKRRVRLVTFSQRVPPTFGEREREKVVHGK
jgi:hypothetical protein